MLVKVCDGQSLAVDLRLSGIVHSWYYSANKHLELRLQQRHILDTCNDYCLSPISVEHCEAFAWGEGPASSPASFDSASPSSTTFTTCTVYISASLPSVLVLRGAILCPRIFLFAFGAIIQFHK